MKCVGRQFPDKAIDLIDEACTIIARKMARIDNEANENTNQSSLTDSVNPESSSTNRGKKAIVVNPNHVAQVATLFCLTSFSSWFCNVI
jgi:ATP-dependent Clp protease ATP-binding subunit ClpA